MSWASSTWSAIASRFSAPKASLNVPGTSISDPQIIEAMTRGTASEAGINVTPEGALSLAPVWQAVSVISGDVATATLNVYKRDANGDREIDREHEVQFLVADEPNEETCAFEFWRRLMLHATLWQNGYAYIERKGRVGKPMGLYNLLPDRTFPRRAASGELFYVTEVDGRPEALLKEEVLHVRGLSINNGVGKELVDAARNSFGLALAAEGFGSKFFANGAQSGGIIEMPIGTSETAADNVMKSIQKKHSGKDNWFKVMVLRDAAKFHATTIDAQKSQLNELREEQVRDIARFFNMPPSKLGLKDSVSYNSAEQAQIEYVTGCLTHWFSAIRGETQQKLLTREERTSHSHFLDHNTSKLYERDLKTMVEILAIERQNEIINAHEWRRVRNLPRRSDAAAEEYLNPNTKSNSSEAKEPEPAKEPTKEKTGSAKALKNLLTESVNRVARRVGLDARRHSKSGQQFQQFVETRAASHQGIFDENLKPVADVIASVRDGTDGVALHGELQYRFFGALNDVLTPVLSMSANELEANTQAACLQFESTIADSIVTAVFEE